jgi:hypothetical protein
MREGFVEELRRRKKGRDDNFYFFERSLEII